MRVFGPPRAGAAAGSQQQCGRPRCAVVGGGSSPSLPSTALPSPAPEVVTADDDSADPFLRGEDHTRCAPRGCGLSGCLAVVVRLLARVVACPRTAVSRHRGSNHPQVPHERVLPLNGLWRHGCVLPGLALRKHRRQEGRKRRHPGTIRQNAAAASAAGAARRRAGGARGAARLEIEPVEDQRFVCAVVDEDAAGRALVPRARSSPPRRCGERVGAEEQRRRVRICRAVRRWLAGEAAGAN